MRRVKQELDALLDRHGVQPVGNGYIDCICPREEAEGFLEELRSLGIVASDYSLWQYRTSEEEIGYGMGGPRCWYREGWYSELYDRLYAFEGFWQMDTFLDNEEIRLQCALVPGFWLNVPEEWRNAGKRQRGKQPECGRDGE